ncbi:MAG TPA: DMT family transporter [Burkholderiaceae bacterium]|nr:DMT family transporter [Burkholderiaceae bacterium]
MNDVAAARWAPWAAAAVGVQVGAAIVATRAVVGELGPVTLAALRYAIGLLTLLPFVWPALRDARAPRIARREWLQIALLGIGQFGLLIALLNIGLRSVPAAKGALLFAAFPLLTLIVATLLGHERLVWRQCLGVALTLAAVALALGPDAWRASGSLAGELAILASALCGAVCSVLYRPVLRRHPALPVSAIAMGAAVVALALCAPFEDAAARMPQVSARGWGAIVFIGTSSGIGYFLWLWALRHAAASRVTLFLSLSPLAAMLLGVLLLGEPLQASLLAALALMAAGLWVAQKRGPFSS